MEGIMTVVSKSIYFIPCVDYLLFLQHLGFHKAFYLSKLSSWSASYIDCTLGT